MQIELPVSAYAMAPLLAIGLGFGIMYVMISSWIYFQKRQRKRSPLTKGHLRGPGESLRKKLDDESMDAQALFFAAFLAPVVVFSIHLSQSYIMRDIRNPA